MRWGASIPMKPVTRFKVPASNRVDNETANINLNNV